MGIDFSEKDILFIYGRFMKDIKELNTLKASPSNPIHSRNINEEIKLLSSVTDKIEKAYPQVCELGKYI